MRARLIAGVVSLTGLVLAGCSSPSITGGTPGPTPTSSAESLPPGTPNVTHPLNVSNFHKTPCSTLTASQLQSLSVTVAGKDVSDANGPSCTWVDLDGPAKMGITVIIPNASQGLAGIYGQKDTFPVFTPLANIGGFPAVIALSADGRSQGNCQVSVGVSNSQLVEVAVTIGAGATDEATPCGRNQTVAADVVATLKG
ncbi:DUF3558 domain-containing protein [Kutzneria buriramensis]|uniref:DUF3558 domain-containing protein n=1 Tax=Kutzneria buriramensis TaxID=1045776 RepID=UPI000E27F5D9